MIELFEKYLDVERVCSTADIIFHYDQLNTFSAYKKTADFLEQQLKEAGPDTVERICIPCDGQFRFGDWIMPLAWDAEEGTLEVIDPRGRRMMLLADYRSVPNSLIRWSRGTCPEGEILELVWLSGATDEKAWQAKDVRGKMVFTQSRPDEAYAFAVKYGAVGIISDCAHDAEEYPRSVHWCNVWTGYHLWGTSKDDTPLLGFSLSPEIGAKLKALMKNAGNPVRVKAVVKARLYEGTTEIVTAAILGSELPDQEVVFYAHVHECYIDDNAVSASGYIEIIRALSFLVRAGLCPRPKRTIRFVMGWEWIGSIYYAMFCRKNKQWLASICHDGLAMKQAICRAPLKIHLSPSFAGSFADRLFVNIWEKVFTARMPMTVWRVMSWAGLSDNYWIDPQCGNVSNLFPYQNVGKSPYHNSHTTIDMIDHEVARCQLLTAMTWAYEIASAGAEEAKHFAQLNAAQIESEIRKYGLEFKFDRDDVECALEQFEREMKYFRKKAERVIDTAVLMPADKSLQGRIKVLMDQAGRVIDDEEETAEEQFERRIRETPEWLAARPLDFSRDRDERLAKNIVPERLAEGMLWSWRKFGQDERVLYRKNGPLDPRVIMLMDGQKSLLDVVRQCEFDDKSRMNLRAILKNLKLLDKAGYIKIHYKQKIRAEDLTAGLKALGLAEGDVALIHSSLSSIGPLENGPESVFQAFEEVVGDKGTIVFPSFTHSSLQWSPDHPYNFCETPAKEGSLTDLFWRRPGVLRSRQPSHAMAAKGKYAELIVENTLSYGPCDIQGSFGKLYMLDAKIVMLGCGLAPNTALHAIEDWIDFPSMRPGHYHYLDETGARKEITYSKVPLGHRSFYTNRLSVYERLFRERGLIREGEVGLARAFVMNMREVVDYGLELFKNGQFDFLICDPNSGCPDCLQTREKAKKWRFPERIKTQTRQMKEKCDGYKDAHQSL